MNAQDKKLQDFAKNYCNTLETDQNGNKFIKIPVENYEELSSFQHYIIKAITYLSDTNLYIKDIESYQFTIHFLARILKPMNLDSEMEGLDKLMELNPKNPQ